MAQTLLIALFLPLAGALLLRGNRDWMRLGSLLVAVVVLIAAIVMAVRYKECPEGGFAYNDFTWAGSLLDVHFHIALDGLSLWLFALTALLMVVAVLVSWEAIAERTSLYYRLLLILETGMLGVFVARDIILFYVFFEFTLVPLFFLIGIWGGPERRRAAAKFFLFTFAGSVLTLLGLLSIVLWNYYEPSVDPALRSLTFSIPDLTEALRNHPMDPTLQIWVFLALFAGFAIKVPLWPLHTWLPLAHVEAPTAGSVILAGVLLKVGAYGFARFNVAMLPQATAALMPWLLWLSLAGIIYGALVALAQTDIKRLVAYSSVSHLGFCMLGLFAVNRLSVQGSVLQMVNHGLSTGGLFAVVGMLYERFHTRQIAELIGLARRLPRLCFFAMVLVLSSIALPGLNGFAGEFPLLLGVFQRAWAEPAPANWLQLRVIAVLSMSGVILGAWYMLWMYQRVFFAKRKGEGKAEGERGVGKAAGRNTIVRDMSVREMLCLSPLLVMIFWIGLQPSFFLDRMAPTLNDLIKPAMEAVERQRMNDGRSRKSEVRNASSGERLRISSFERRTSP
ncbi:MAG: NADH-quinone oxidoreductase subunit M [Planctomycetaceae bacterium]|nr:NADH-quinone oxidoreductase subunit M [Planctomycetaceae bacterium]